MVLSPKGLDIRQGGDCCVWLIPGKRTDAGAERQHLSNWGSFIVICRFWIKWVGGAGATPPRYGTG